VQITKDVAHIFVLRFKKKTISVSFEEMSGATFGIHFGLPTFWAIFWATFYPNHLVTL
jgi:hypothetical protein